MYFVTNLFLVMRVQNLSKSVKICHAELLTKVCCHVFYAPQCTMSSSVQGGPKKLHTELMAITLSILNGFSKFFHCWKAK